MKPKPFQDSNTTFTLPTGENPLPVFQDDEHIISCWEFEGKEKLLALFNGHIWCRVWGAKQFPLYLEVNNPFFTVGSTPDDFDLIINQFVERKVKQFLAPQEKDLDEKSRKFAENMLVAFLHFVFVSSEGE